MDPASATISAVSLATAVSGTFTSIVQCLEYVELGRNFGKDFNKSQVKLEALKLRLSRWGTSVGILVNSSSVQIPSLSTSAQEVEQVEELLAVILDDIQTVQHKSSRYAGLPSSRQGDKQALKVFDVNDLDPMHALVVQKAAATFKKRVRQVGWGKKTKWAVFEKKQFDSLLSDISENTSNLEQLFPASRKAQMQLSSIEVEEIRGADAGDGEQTLAVLGEAIGRDSEHGDKFLEQAIDEAMKREATHVYLRTEAREDAKLDQGDLIHKGFKGEIPKGRRGHTYGTTILSGRATGRQGDTFGSKPDNDPF